MYTKNFTIKSLTITLFFICFFPVFSKAQLSEQWVYRYNGSGNWTDYIDSKSAAIDAAGNIYAAVSAYTANSRHEIILMKFPANGPGTPVILNTYQAGSFVSELTLDNSNNIYIALKNYVNNQCDVVTLKYNSNGVLLWERRYNGLLNSNDEATCMTIDQSGNVYVAGFSYAVAGQNYDYLLLKYNSSGLLQWVRTYDGTSSGNDDDRINSIACDASGNVFVTGKAGWSGSGYDIITIRYTPNGNFSIARYDGAEHSNDEGIKVVIDQAGNFIVTGSTIENGNDPEITTIKYSPAFVTLWTRTYNNNDEVPSDLKLDAAGNVYVNGNVSGIGSVVIKYTSNGGEQWVALNTNFIARSMTLDGNGNIYITGGNSDIITVKYNNNGVQIGNNLIYNGTGNSQDWGMQVLSTGNGSSVFVTGMSYGTSSMDIAVIKYSLPMAIENNNNEIPVNIELQQNYPNPFNPSTTISFKIASSSDVKIVVYNSAGKEVTGLVNEKLNSGSYDIIFDASGLTSGVYFYTLYVNGVKIDTKKMILIK